MSQEVALKQKISDMVAEYQAKKEAIPRIHREFEESVKELGMACAVQGTYGQVNLDTGRLQQRSMFESLLKSAWLHIHKDLNFRLIMSAKDQKIFEQSLNDPPEFNIENIRATFGDYILDPFGNILRGLAEVFCDLDRSYKSHDKVKIGVDGLPKRIIMSGFGGYSDYGWEKFCDVVNALASYQGKPLFTSHWLLKNSYQDETEAFEKKYGMSLKLFKNGNGHIIFDPETLKDINRALSEYYGEVLADCHEARPEKRKESTDVSKDLQYYPTPKAVVDRIIEDLYIRKPELILEPSCGCGRFMDAIASIRGGHTIHGIEVDPKRAEEARSKGHKVQTGNFLATEPTPKYDRVIMNPPFYGKHYAKHIEHALKFLKDGGVLTSILPITARDHGLVDGKWSDLPVGSFRESGTNINTTILTIIK